MARKKRQHSVSKRAATSFTEEDLLLVKSTVVGVQAVHFSKERFLSFEKAASKAEQMGLDLSKQSETVDDFIFEQIAQGSFKEHSIREMELEAGVKMMIGVLGENSAPMLPHDSNAVSEIEKPVQGEDPTQLSSVDSGPEMVEVSADQEMEAFAEVEHSQSLGYVFMSVDEAELMTGLKTEFAAQLQALKVVTETIAPSTTEFLDQMIEKSEENQVLIGLLDRVNTGLVLLSESCAKLDLPVEVAIDKSLAEELVNQDKESTVLALKTLGDVLSPVIDLFEDTSFERFHSLCKSLLLSSTRLNQEFLEVEKGLSPEPDMDREGLIRAQKARSEKWGIEIVKGSSLKFPEGFPEELSEYGDPVNLKFPFESAEKSRNARVRFKQFADEIYEEKSSKQIIHERIVKRELEFGVTVVLNKEDPLDSLLPEAVFEDEGVTIFDKVWDPKKDKKTKKSVFVPIQKESEEERTVLGIVLEPDVVDLHGDTYDEKSVRDAAWFFMEEMQNIGKNHTSFVNDQVAILESYATPVDIEMETPMGLIKIKKNTWLMRVRIKDTALWNEVKTGELTGFSIGAMVTAEKLEKQ